MSTQLDGGDPAQVLGRILATKRREVGLSQEALAYRCKLHPTYISHLERGVNSPTVRVLFDLARNLNTTASSILAEVERVLTSEQGA